MDFFVTTPETFEKFTRIYAKEIKFQRELIRAQNQSSPDYDPVKDAAAKKVGDRKIYDEYTLRLWILYEFAEKGIWCPS